MREIDAHFDAYEHLKHLPREGEALHMLRKVASMVKPMMRKRGWKVVTLAEFLPDEPQLLGLNINRTERILIRLRYHHDSRQFLSMEQVTDTLLHELSHIIWGPHDNNFHNLWNELRDEHQSLIAKGYSGEGFLSQGHKLGGKRIPLDEIRRQARIAAEKRKATTNQSGAGRRLGGQAIARGVDMRKVIADAAKRRNSITEGCASGSAQAPNLINQQARDGFRTKAEETDANDLAIAEALQELMEEEEMLKLEELCAPNGGGGLAWDPVNGLQFDNDPPSRTSTPRATPSSPGTPPPNSRRRPLSRLVTEDANLRSRPKSTPIMRPASRLIAPEEANLRNKNLPPSPPPESPPQSTVPTNPDEWACPQCTLHNPLEFLSCEACGLEQPPQPIPPNQRYGPTNHPAALPKPPPAADMRGKGVTPFEPARGRIGWNCLNCGTFMGHDCRACSLCGTISLEL